MLVLQTTLAMDAGTSRTRLVERVFRALQRKAPASRTHAQPLPGYPPQAFELWQAEAMKTMGGYGVDAESAQWLSLRHGTHVERIAELLREHPEWRQRLHPEAPFIQAEAILAVRDEMAL